MHYWRRNLTVLTMAALAANIGFQLTTPFLPELLKELGLKSNLSQWSGVMLAVNSLTYAVMAPVWGSMADRYGKRVMLLRSGLGIAATYVLMALSSNHLQLLGLRALNGMLSGFIPSSILLVATNTPEANLGFALGMIQTATSAGQILGPMVGGFGARLLGVRSTLFAGAALLALAAFFGFFCTKEEVSPPKEKSKVFRDFTMVLGNSSLRVIILSYVLVSTALMVVQPTLPLFVGKMVARDVTVITGIIFSITGVSMALGAPFFGKLRNANHLGVFVLGVAAAAVLSVFQGFAHSTWVLGGERFLFGFANAAMAVSVNVLLTQYTDPSERGRTFGAFNGITSLGSVVGPMIGGVMGDSFGLASPFFGSAFIFVLSGWIVWAGLNARQAVLETKVGMWWSQWQGNHHHGGMGPMRRRK